MCMLLHKHMPVWVTGIYVPVSVHGFMYILPALVNYDVAISSSPVQFYQQHINASLGHFATL